MDELPSRRSDLFLKILSIFVFIGLLGAVKPVLFNEGSAMAKYLAKQKQLEMVQEENIEQYMESALFGDGNVELQSSSEGFTEEERNNTVSAIFKYDSILAACLFISMLFLLWPKLSFSFPFYHILIPISLWLLCQSIAISLNGGKKFSDLAVLAHATRWILPLVLWLGLFLRRKGKDLFESNLLIIMAVLSSSITFAVHGWEAFSLNPSFQDLIYNFAALLSWDVSVSTNSAILKAVGCMDILLALSLLFIRRPKVILWMAIWGLVTAISRPLTMGIEAWPETAIRIANFIMPFFLYLIYRKQAEEQLASDPVLKKQKLEINYE